MIRIVALGILLVASSLGAETRETTTETWTGWFSDKQCARIRAGEAARPNGTACVKKCLHAGSPAVFISEQAQAIYDVHDFAAVEDEVGYYLKITAEVDEKARTIFVKSVTRLAEVTAMCALPKKPRS